MWEPIVVKAYVALIKAAAARYNDNPRIEGLILQESALRLNGAYSQDVADGGTYTAEAWRDALIELVGQCGAAFSQGHCMSFMNFIRGGQQYLYDVSAAIAAVPGNGACMSGPDLLRTIHPSTGHKRACTRSSRGTTAVARTVPRMTPIEVRGCALECIFQFAVSGTFGDFAETVPRTSGVCVNSYLFWNHRNRSATGLDWTDALTVIAAYPYGRAWLDQCVGGGGKP